MCRGRYGGGGVAVAFCGEERVEGASGLRVEEGGACAGRGGGGGGGEEGGAADAVRHCADAACEGYGREAREAVHRVRVHRPAGPESECKACDAVSMHGTNRYIVLCYVR